MKKTCYVCNQPFGPTSLKTPRSRFKVMGLSAPEGMSGQDRVCARCLYKIYDEETKRTRVEKLKEQMKKELVESPYERQKKPQQKINKMS